MWLGLWLFTTACFTFCGWAMAQQIHELCHARVVRADNSTLAAGCVWFLVTSGCLGIFHDIYSPCKHKSEGLLSQAQHMRSSSFPCVAVSLKQLHCHFIMSHLSFCLLHLEIYIYGWVFFFFQTESGLRLKHCRPFSAVRAHLVYFHSSLESILAPNSWTRNQSCLTFTYYSVLLRNTNVHSCQLHTVNTVSFFSLFFKDELLQGKSPSNDQLLSPSVCD